MTGDRPSFPTPHSFVALFGEGLKNTPLFIFNERLQINRKLEQKVRSKPVARAPVSDKGKARFVNVKI